MGSLFRLFRPKFMVLKSRVRFGLWALNISVHHTCDIHPPTHFSGTQTGVKTIMGTLGVLVGRSCPLLLPGDQSSVRFVYSRQMGHFRLVWSFQSWLHRNWWSIFLVNVFFLTLKMKMCFFNFEKKNILKNFENETTLDFIEKTKSILDVYNLCVIIHTYKHAYFFIHFPIFYFF